MVRELRLTLLAAVCPACSLVLDFSDSAAPLDASSDAPYTQAQCDYKEPNDSIAAPSMLATGDTGPAAICKPAAGSAEDRDFYQFTKTAAAVTVAIQFMNRPGGDLDIKIYDDTGTMVGQSRGFADGETVTCPGTAPSCPMLAAGNYVLEVFPAVPGAVNAYTFSIAN